MLLTACGRASYQLGASAAGSSHLPYPSFIRRPYSFPTLRGLYSPVIANNLDSPPGTIDLHGLYVREAIERTEKAIADAQRKGDREMRVIVGKGIHSQGHVAKIKPAVEDLMRK